MTGVLPLRLETSDGIARSILEMELYGLGFDYISKYPAIIRSLTPEYVGEVARLRLSSTDYVVSIAGPPVENG
jgi:zinc protease